MRSGEGEEEAPAWRLIEEPPTDGYRNMAVDESLLESCAGGGPGFPCLRLYAFSPPCLSLGFSQDHADAVDLAYCRRRGIDVVRRPTGGRAVLHDDEITYAVVARHGVPPFAGTVLDTYTVIARALIASFARVGVETAITSGATSSGSPREGAICFAEPSRHEIAAGAYKVAGSAQARRRGAFLQHGSIPITLDVVTLAGAAGALPGAPRGLRGEDLREMKGLAQISERPLAFSDLRVALREGFRQALGILLEPRSLAAAERERAEWLRAHRYLTAAWTLRR